MIATCLTNQPMDVPPHQRTRVAQSEGPYPLTPGREYKVVGIMAWETTLMFLVRDDHGLPRFAPASFFSTLTAPVPDGWMFSLGDGAHAFGTELWTKPVVAMWGYRELVEDAGHGGALELGEPSAIAVFEQFFEASR